MFFKVPHIAGHKSNLSYMAFLAMVIMFL